MFPRMPHAMLTTATPTTNTATATATPATLTLLHELLDAGQAWSATYRGALSSHLPMALQALLEMGASAERLRAWSEGYETMLEPRGQARPARIVPGRDLGRPDSDASWRAHFAGRMAERGRDAALREALALLLPGVGAAAFHGLIRTGHAVLAGHDGELAAGLAHWAAHFLPMPASPAHPAHPARPALTTPLWLAALARLPRPGEPAAPARGLIFERMRAWSAAPGFADAACGLQRTPGTLRELALLAARTYAATGNFTVLHLLTASHAMAVLEPWWPTPDLPQDFIVAAAAGLLASGAAPVQQLDHPPSRPWPALISAACAQDDAHVIKLTHAAWRLERRWPDPAWRCAAERVIPL